MDLRYRLNDLPPFKDTFFHGVQWFVLTIPIIVILGKITSDFHVLKAGDPIEYLQRLIFLMGVTMMVQVLVGHGLPLVVGPSAALLVGFMAAGDASKEAVHSAIIVGGGCVFFLGITGAFRYLKVFFTHRVITTMVFLIAFSLLPTVVKLILWSGSPAFLNIIFSLVVIMATAVLHSSLKGVGRSTVIIWVMVGASVCYYFIFPSAKAHAPAPDLLSLTFLSYERYSFTFDPGIFISFFFCFLALTINDVSSVESLNELLHPSHGEKRVSKSLLVTGLANVFSGVLGVIGPVNYSLSPGVISSSRCASRYPLFITAGLIMLLSLSPMAIRIIGYLPPPVVGAILAYLLGAQVQAGIYMWWEGEKEMDFDRGLIVIIPVIVAVVVAFMPPTAFSGLPLSLRPIAENGFVMGIFSCLVLEGFWRWRDR